jgi:iron complex outermembrane receptor protein
VSAWADTSWGIASIICFRISSDASIHVLKKRKFLGGNMANLHHNFHYVWSALLLGTALSVMPGVVPAQQASAELEEVVVTAQKREENLQVVPVAVTALTAQALETIRYRDVKDLNAAAPGLTVRESGGGLEEPVFTMRGVYATAAFPNEPGVALYLDGVYISNVLGAQFDLADIERIEVLRGPQGTLFGRNAIAGAVNIITPEPSGKLHVTQEISYGNLSQRRYKTSLDSPTWGPLSASFNYLHDQADGDVYNLGAGTVWHFGPATDGKYGDLVSPSTLGGHRTDAIAAALKFEMDSGFKAVYRFNNTHQSYDPDASAPGSFGTSVGFIFQPFWAAQNPAQRSPLGTLRPDAVNNWYTTPGLVQVQSHALTLTAPITHYISVKSLTSYRTLNVASTNDLGGVGGILLAPGLPLLPIVNNVQSDQKSWQEEIDVGIDTKWVKSTVGYLHWRGNTIEGNYPNTINSPFGSGIGFTPAYVNFTAPRVDSVNGDLTTWSDAVYTQNEVPITRQLSLVGGGRWTSDRRNGIEGASTPPASAVGTIDYHKSQWTYLAGFNYKVTDDIFAYIKNSTGYISGGEVSNIKFDPATAKSWEAGLKADLFDRTLRTNLALFTVEYGQFQILTSPRAGCPPSIFPQVSPFAAFCIINGGDAKDGGVELEVTYVPVTGVTLEGSVAHNNMHFTRVNHGLRASDGSFVAPQSPVWTGMLAANYRGPDMSSLAQAHLTATAQAQYTSSAYPQTGDTIALLNTVRIPARTIVNARAGLGGFRAGPVEIEVAGYVKNATNNRAEAFGANLGADYGVTFQRAREYGIDLKASF